MRNKQRSGGILPKAGLGRGPLMFTKHTRRLQSLAPSQKVTTPAMRASRPKRIACRRAVIFCSVGRSGKELGRRPERSDRSKACRTLRSWSKT